MATFTKEQLIDHLYERMETRRGLLEAQATECGLCEYLRKEIATDEIALAALTAPDCPPKDTGAAGRSMDASYRRQGAVTGWAACLHRILKGLE